MKMRFPIAVILAGLVSAGGVAAAGEAQAQQSPPNETSSSMTKGDMTRGDHDHDQRFSAADRAAFFEARIAALHAGLTLTPDQEKLWPPIEAALRDTAKTMADRRKMWKDEPKPSDPVQMLQRISAGALARGETLKKLADAMSPLYATLNDEQKHRLPVLLAHLRPHGMHFAMAGEHGPGEEDGDHHGWSHEHHDHFHGGDHDDDWHH